MAKLLLCDDSALILAMLETCLLPLGHELVKVSDGYSVVPQLLQTKPDLIILDYQMPAASGVEVYGRLRNLDAGAKIPVIFLTGMSPYELQYVIPETPLVRFFQKPVDLTELQKAVTEMLAASAPKPPGPPPTF